MGPDLEFSLSAIKAQIKKEAHLVVSWFNKNSRPLPWRQSRDPYKIWISEVMLQQTTSRAVTTYFEKFIKVFPDCKSLAQASLTQVYPLWAGLGYYSRVRNLHKSARLLLDRKEFPQTYKEWIQLPGLGPYTSRAVTSQAFGEKVGVVDGNVIRVLSRCFALKWPWWKEPGKTHLQLLADEFAQTQDPSSVNQGLMELGATVCTPRSPSCWQCPLAPRCKSKGRDWIQELPLKKPQRDKEIWLWKAQLCVRKKKLAFVVNDYAPFLKKQLFFPGQVRRLKKSPKKFDFQHGITHHRIFVQLEKVKPSQWLRDNPSAKTSCFWMSSQEWSKKSPFSLIQKAVDIGLGKGF